MLWTTLARKTVSTKTVAGCQGPYSYINIVYYSISSLLQQLLGFTHFYCSLRQDDWSTSSSPYKHLISKWLPSDILQLLFWICIWQPSAALHQILIDQLLASASQQPISIGLLHTLLRHTCMLSEIQLMNHAAGAALAMQATFRTKCPQSESLGLQDAVSSGITQGNI